MSHLSSEILLDVAEGTRSESAVAHLATCAVCREQLADLRETMAIIAVEVPEPSPLFWDHLSVRVREAVAAEATHSTSRWSFRRVSFTLAGAMSAAAVVIAVSLTMRTPELIDMPSGTVPPAVTVVDDIRTTAEDPSLSLLADLAGGLDWDSAAEAGMTMEAGEVDNRLTELTDAERIELQRLLREAMSGSGA